MRFISPWIILTSLVSRTARPKIRLKVLRIWSGFSELRKSMLNSVCFIWAYIRSILLISARSPEKVFFKGFLMPCFEISYRQTVNAWDRFMDGNALWVEMATKYWQRDSSDVVNPLSSRPRTMAHFISSGSSAIFLPAVSGVKKFCLYFPDRLVVPKAQ